METPDVDQGRKQATGNPARGKHEKRKCARKGCGRSFVPVHARQVFCSGECRKKHDNAKRRQPKIPPHTRKVEAGSVCHDCGRDSKGQYRCNACRAAWMAKHGVSPSDDGSGYEAWW